MAKKKSVKKTVKRGSGARKDKVLDISKILNGYASHKIVLDKKGKPVDYIFMEVNRAFEKATGLKKNKIIGKGVREVIPGITKSDFDWIGEYGKVALTGKPKKFRQYSEMLNKWYEIYAYSEKKGYFTTVFSDVSDEVNLKERAEKQMKEMRMYLELTGSIILVLDKDANIVVINRKGYELLGYKSENKLIGRNWIDEFIPERIRDSILKLHKSYLKKSLKMENHKYENPIVDRKGNEHLISWTTNTIVNDMGEIVGTIDSGEDVTELRKKEKEIQETAENLSRQNMLNNLRADIWKLSSDPGLTIEQSIVKIMARVGPVINASRVSYNIIKNNDMVCVKEWRAKGISSSIGSKLPMKIVKYVLKRNLWNISLESLINMLPKVMRSVVRPIMSNYVRNYDLLSVAVMPFYIKGELKGSVTFDICRSNKERTQWKEEDNNILTEIVSIIQDKKMQESYEEELRSSEKRFRTIFEAAPDAYYLIDFSGHLIDGNLAAEKLLGYNRKELIGMRFDKAGIMSVKDIPKAFRSLAKNMKGKPSGPDVYTMINKKGGNLSVEVLTRPVEIDGKRFALGIARDITEKTIIEKQIEENEEKYRTMFYKAGEPMCIYEIMPNKSPGKLIDVNEITAKKLGYTREELVGMNLRDIDTGNLKTKDIINVTKQLLKTGNANLEREVVAKTGRKIPVEIHINTMKLKGETVGFAIVKDLTERKIANAKLEMDAKILESVQDSVFVFDYEGNLFYVNERAYQDRGYTKDEIMKGGLKIVLADEYKKKLPVFLNRIKSQGFAVIESRHRRKDGSEFPVEVHSRLIELSGKEFFLAVGRDVTTRKKIEEELMNRVDELDKILNTTADAIRFVSLDGMIVKVNKRYLEITGYEESELVGQDCSTVSGSSARCDTAECTLKRVLSGEKIVDEDIELRTKNGDIRYCIMSAEPFTNHKGGIIGVIEDMRDITERKKDVDEIRKLYAAVEQSPASIEITDLDGNITYVNPTFEKVTGYSKDEVLGKSPRVLKSGEMSDDEYKRMWDGLVRGIEWKGEFHNKRKNGTLFWESASISPVKNEKGEIINYIAIKEDITIQKEFEKQLLLHSELLSSVSDSIFLHSPDGIIEYVNDAAVNNLGYSRKKILEMNTTELEVGKDVAHLKEMVNESELVYETVYKTKNGEFNDVEVRSRIIDIDGEKKVLSVARDITDRKRAADEIRTSQEFLQDFLDNANDLIQIVKPDGTFEYVNNAWNNALGYSDEELKDMKIFDIIHISKVDKCMDMFKRVMTGECESSIETIFVAKNGREIEVEGHVTCNYEDGQAKSTRAIFRDVTEKRAAERQLQESYDRLKEVDAIKTNFVSMVSHELRTPLTSIKGFLSFLINGVAGPVNDKQKEFLETIKSNSERQLMLINDLLDMSKMEAGTFQIETETKDIIEVINVSIREIMPVASKKRIAVKNVSKLESLDVCIDEYRVNQIIVNLVNNSLKFSYENSTISIDVKEVEKSDVNIPEYVNKEKLNLIKYVMLTVSDEGMGIEKEQASKIFDKFYQVSGSDRAIYKGVGLGLNITKNIVEAHSGIIWVESEGKNKGSTFVILLPAGACHDR